MTRTFSDLQLVNTKINLLPYKSEVDEDWCPITDAGEGDCDSYATAKQWRLVHAYGWPAESTRLACCFVEHEHNPDKSKRYHLVLLVDFNDQTYVLDNRWPHPMEHALLDYEWHKFWSHELNDWEWAKNADRSYT